jgi:hypothetical protein
MRPGRSNFKNKEDEVALTEQNPLFFSAGSACSLDVIPEKYSRTVLRCLFTSWHDRANPTGQEHYPCLYLYDRSCSLLKDPRDGEERGDAGKRAFK